MSSKRFPSKQAREFHRQAVQRGWTLVRQNRHLVYQHPLAGQLTVAATPSDSRAVKNNLARLQRMMRAAGL